MSKKRGSAWKQYLSIDIFDNEGQRNMPIEWFIAPFEIIEKRI